MIGIVPTLVYRVARVGNIGYDWIACFDVSLSVLHASSRQSLICDTNRESQEMVEFWKWRGREGGLKLWEISSSLMWHSRHCGCLWIVAGYRFLSMSYTGWVGLDWMAAMYMIETTDIIVWEHLIIQKRTKRGGETVSWAELSWIESYWVCNWTAFERVKRSPLLSCFHDFDIIQANNFIISSITTHHRVTPQEAWCEVFLFFCYTSYGWVLYVTCISRRRHLNGQCTKV